MDKLSNVIKHHGTYSLVPPRNSEGKVKNVEVYKLNFSKFLKKETLPPIPPEYLSLLESKLFAIPASELKLVMFLLNQGISELRNPLYKHVFYEYDFYLKSNIGITYVVNAFKVLSGFCYSEKEKYYDKFQKTIRNSDFSTLAAICFIDTFYEGKILDTYKGFFAKNITHKEMDRTFLFKEINSYRLLRIKINNKEFEVGVLPEKFNFIDPLSIEGFEVTPTKTPYNIRTFEFNTVSYFYNTKDFEIVKVIKRTFKVNAKSDSQALEVAKEYVYKMEGIEKEFKTHLSTNDSNFYSTHEFKQEVVKYCDLHKLCEIYDSNI